MNEPAEDPVAVAVPVTTATVAAVARGWAVLLAVLVSVTTPLLFLQTTVAGSSGQELDESTSFWSALGEVLVAPSGDFAGDDETAVRLALVRVGLAALAVGLAIAVALAVRWVDPARPVEERSALHVLAAVLLAGGVLLVVVGAAAVGDPSAESDVRRGVDAGAGLLAPLVVAGLLLGARREPRLPHGWNAAERIE